MTNGNETVEHDDLPTSYDELADGVRMIRRAVDRAVRAGVLPPIEGSSDQPLQQCEAMARAIYAAAISRHALPAPKRKLKPDFSS
jgi:hypothetical protein